MSEINNINNIVKDLKKITETNSDGLKVNSLFIRKNLQNSIKQNEMRD